MSNSNGIPGIALILLEHLSLVAIYVDGTHTEVVVSSISPPMGVTLTPAAGERESEAAQEDL